MKKFTLTLISVMGVMVATAVATLADNNFSGNQLQKNYTHWYEKAATTVGPYLPARKGDWVLQPGSYLYLEGNSTLHKYQMNARSLLGSAVMKAPKKDLGKSLEANGVDSMVLVIPLESLKSKEKGLDDNAYKALASKANPNIQFFLESEAIKGSLMTAKGNLTIAGKTVPITLTAETEIIDNRIHLKGVQELKMSDYQITPPSISLLVTSITCSDDVSIHYDVTFSWAK